MLDIRWLMTIVLVVVLPFGFAACDDGEESNYGGGDLSGSVRIGGSNAVAPLTEAIADEFRALNPDVDFAIDGSGGGTPVAVANDAIVVILNPSNPKYCIRVEHLEQIWRPQDPISSWTEVGDDEPLDAEIQRFGPAPASEAFGFFTEAINGDAGVQTKRYAKAGADEGLTVAGVSASKGGIGYLRLTSFEEDRRGVKAAAVESEETGICVVPSALTVQDGSYSPLSRELFVYPSEGPLGDPVERAFLRYYLARAAEVAPTVGLLPLGIDQLEESERRISGPAG